MELPILISRESEDRAVRCRKWGGCRGGTCQMAVYKIVSLWSRALNLCPLSRDGGRCAVPAEIGAWARHPLEVDVNISEATGSSPPPVGADALTYDVFINEAPPQDGALPNGEPKRFSP